MRDNRHDAWQRLIDSLLASPRYGLRWGRHWLDVARYSDSNGTDEDIGNPEAYRYRNYVIAAFNHDKPFDRFIIEQLAGDAQAPMPADQSGRLELAEWIASSDNPLTARVIANRIWRWHFGRGIVETVDNFGTLGVKPTHPELLDHLAGLLIEKDWSIKQLHREIMTSATYQQSPIASRSLKESDPENRLFARWLPRRIEAEAVRDCILAKSDQLDFESTGPKISTSATQSVDRGEAISHHDDHCRTVYLPVLRSSGYDSQNAFDFPDPATICGHRRTSTVAPQALFLMNSPMVHKASSKYAQSLLQLKESDRATAAIRHLLGRDPSDAELERCAAFIKNYSPDNAAAAWAAFTRALFATNEFLYIE